MSVYHREVLPCVFVLDISSISNLVLLFWLSIRISKPDYRLSSFCFACSCCNPWLCCLDSPQQTTYRFSPLHPVSHLIWQHPYQFHDLQRQISRVFCWEGTNLWEDTTLQIECLETLAWKSWEWSSVLLFLVSGRLESVFPTVPAQRKTTEHAPVTLNSFFQPSTSVIMLFN